MLDMMLSFACLSLVLKIDIFITMIFINISVEGKKNLIIIIINKKH